METKSTTFPEKWAIEITDENRQIVGEWFNKNGNTSHTLYHIKLDTLPYLAFPGNSSHYFSKREVEGNEYTIITFEEFKRNILKMDDKQIIGYKLIKPEYKEAALIISGTKVNWENSLMEYDISINQKSYINKLKSAQVFEKWFEPVYEEKFTYKQGDYLYCKEDFQMNAGWIAYKKGRVYLADYNDSIIDEQNSTHTMPNTNYGGKTLSYYFRHATKQEIEQLYNSKKTLTIGTSSIKVEISKGKIVAEGKIIDANSLSKLVHDMDGNNRSYNLPWNVGFGSTCTIGCSSFKQGELNSVLEAYDEINNTSYALLPF